MNVLAAAVILAASTTVTQGFEPNPIEWKGLAAETAVESATLGIQGCQGFFTSAPVVTIESAETLKSAFVLTLDAAPANRLLLGVRFSDGSSICGKSDKPGPTFVRFNELTKGKTELFVGHLMKNVKLAPTIAFAELGRTAKGTLSKSAENPATFMHLNGRTSVDPQKLGHPGGYQCSANFPAEPQLVLEVTEAIESDVVVSLLNLPGGSLLVRTSDGTVDCYESPTIGSPKLTRKGVPAGRMEVFAGFSQNGYYFDVNLQIEDLARTKAAASAAFSASPAGKKADFCGPDQKKLKERFPNVKLPAALVINTVCAEPYSWSAVLNRGVQTAVDSGESHPLYAAALVASCRSLGDQAYYGWRQCKRESVKVTDAAAVESAVDQALTGLPAAAGAKELFLQHFRAGVDRIAKLDASMTEHEKGYPNEKALFDDVAKMVETKYRPAFKQFAPTLAEIETWRVEVAKGPGFAQGCEEKWQKALQGYATKAAPKAKDEALAEALWTPVGHRMVQALAWCQEVIGPSRAKIHGVRGMLPGGGSFTGTYEMEAELLRDRSYVRKEYEGMPTSSWTRTMELRTDDEESLTRKLGGPWYSSGRWRFTGGSEVLSVVPKGALATITFKRVSRKDFELYDCVEGRITRIDERGYIHRESKCKERPITVDETPPSVTVPKSETARVTPGARVQIAYDDAKDKAARTGHVLWVKRGADLVWVAGISTP